MAARKLNANQIQEVRSLRDRCILVLRFLNRRGELGDQFGQFEEVIHRSYENEDLRGLRLLRREFDDWSKDLGAEEQLELETLLRVELGVDVDEEHATDLTQVRQIEARGRIRNEREYRLVQARLEELHASSADTTEAERLAALLASY
jgi:hypothetical protein